MRKANQGRQTNNICCFFLWKTPVVRCVEYVCVLVLRNDRSLAGDQLAAKCIKKVDEAPSLKWMSLNV
jgi:hypothetical protein